MNRKRLCEDRAKDDVPYGRTCPYECPFGVDIEADRPPEQLSLKGPY